VLTKIQLGPPVPGGEQHDGLVGTQIGRASAVATQIGHASAVAVIRDVGHCVATTGRFRPPHLVVHSRAEQLRLHELMRHAVEDPRLRFLDRVDNAPTRQRRQLGSWFAGSRRRRRRHRAVTTHDGGHGSALDGGSKTPGLRGMWRSACLMYSSRIMSWEHAKK